MSIGDFGAISAVVISLLALLFSSNARVKTRTQEGAAQSLSGFANLEQMIKDVPGALRFHGITENELKIAGLTSGEMAYFLSNMTTGGIYYRTTEETGLIQFFEQSGYYGEMFKHEPTRNAWAICRCCLAPSPYREKLDELSNLYLGPSEELALHLENKFIVEKNSNPQFSTINSHDSDHVKS